MAEQSQFEKWRIDRKREPEILRTLRHLARQRVALILQPGNVWVIEGALTVDDQVRADLRTCLLRGWIEGASGPIPTGPVNKDGSIPGQWPKSLDPVFKVTAAGWVVIQNTRTLLTLKVLVAILSVAASIASVLAIVK